MDHYITVKPEPPMESKMFNSEGPTSSEMEYYHSSDGSSTGTNSKMELDIKSAIDMNAMTDEIYFPDSNTHVRIIRLTDCNQQNAPLSARCIAQTDEAMMQHIGETILQTDGGEFFVLAIEDVEDVGTDSDITTGGFVQFDTSSMQHDIAQELFSSENNNGELCAMNSMICIDGSNVQAVAQGKYR